MRIALYAEDLGQLSGAVLHGLMLLEPLAGVHDLTLLYRTPRDLRFSSIKTQFGFSPEHLHLRRVDSCWMASRLSAEFDLFINTTASSLVPGRARQNMLLVFFPFALDDFSPGWAAAIARSGQRLRQGLLDWAHALGPDIGMLGFGEYRAAHGTAAAVARLPGFVLRKLGWMRPNHLHLGYPALDSYDLILANSQYTAAWIRRYYRRDSMLNYPPVRTQLFVPAAKRPLILSVGRLEAGPMSKGQEFLLHVFKVLHDEGLLAGWRLCLCGYGDASSHYLEQLRSGAANYPVDIELNARFERVAELYSQASLYWHAMGFGCDAQKHPESFEHFGLTTAEAMSAGCVPMTFAGGGQEEIVNDAQVGFVWRTLDELAAQVRTFTAMSPAQQHRMRCAARRRVEEFRSERFVERTVEAYGALGIACRAARPLRLAA